LTWIRGLDAEAWFDRGRLVLHANVVMPAHGSAAGKANKPAPGGKSF
jgi:hypothetical protein